MISLIQGKRSRSTGLLSVVLAFAWGLCLALPSNAQSAGTQPVTTQGSDTTRQQLTSFDRFLDEHPGIAEELRERPSLVNSSDFLEGHPALQKYMSQHPEVREEFEENPNAFMHQKERYDQREDRRMAATTDQFLDAHPEIAEQLRKDPSLVNDPHFVQQHPALQQFLEQHPELRQEFRDNPNAFMQQEQRFEQRENTRGMNGTNGTQAGFVQFLSDHSAIAQEISRDPALLQNDEYLKNHPALEQYLRAHPQARSDFAQNPEAFMSSLPQGANSSIKGTSGNTKAKQP
jgi:hypothetical protein